MSELKFTRGLKNTLGKENIAKVTALKDLLEETERNLETIDYSKVPNSLLITVLRKRRTLNLFLGKVKNSNEKNGSLERRSDEIKDAMRELLGDGDVTQFRKDLEEEIKAVKSVLGDKIKETAIQLNKETAQVAQNVDTRICEDIDLVKQQKQELMEKRTQLIQKTKEIEQKYSKAMIEYKKNQGFFATFREIRSNKDEETGKKPGVLAAFKAAFVAVRENKTDEVDRKRQAEIAEILAQITEAENEIAACDAKIGALNEQRKVVRQEILKENALLANALKEHLEKAEEIEVEHEALQVGMALEQDGLEMLKHLEDKEGHSEELSVEIKASEEAIEYLSNLSTVSVKKQENRANDLGDEEKRDLEMEAEQTDKNENDEVEKQEENENTKAEKNDYRRIRNNFDMDR